MKLTYKLSEVFWLPEVPFVSEDHVFHAVYRPIYDVADALRREARVEAVFMEEDEDAGS